MTEPYHNTDGFSPMEYFTYVTRYARWIPDDQKRESWTLTVRRYISFFKKKLNLDDDLCEYLYNCIYDRHVMPSMRCLMTAGPALERDEVAGYNCAYNVISGEIDRIKIEHEKLDEPFYINISSPIDFDEMAYILLVGTGVGYSVERQFINNLPKVGKKLNRSIYKRNNENYPGVPLEELSTYSSKFNRVTVMDSKYGWASAIRIMIVELYNGNWDITWDTSLLRPAGAILKTFGGRASGPGPLVDLFNFLKSMFKLADGRKLTSIECYDICCKISQIVVSGGVRRSASISFSNLSDDRMKRAKMGSWWLEEPQRALANNSVAYTEKPDFESFLSEMKSVYKSRMGERGIFNREAAKRKFEELGREWDDGVGTNPCFTGDTIVAVADGRNGVPISQLAEECKKGSLFPVYSARWNPSKKTWITEIQLATAFESGVKETIQVILSDGSSIYCTPDHKLYLTNGESIEAKDSLGHVLSKFYSFSEKNTNKSYRHINSKSNGGSRQYYKIWDFYNGSYNGSEFNIHHIDGDSTNDFINNLCLEPASHRCGSHSINNGINPLSVQKNREPDLFFYEQRRKNILGNAKRYDWDIEKIQIEIDKLGPKPVVEDKNTYLDESVYVEHIVMNGVEKVYDLTVDKNHNFYIITKTVDDRFLNSSGVLVHNCGEILLIPKEFCNLSTGIIKPKDNYRTIEQKVRVAAILGTMQATLTDFKYLRPAWKENTERERLIGVSMTGIMDHPVMSGIEIGSGLDWFYEGTDFDPLNTTLNDILAALRLEVKEANKEYAAKFGITPATACTTIKPEGTTSTLCGTSSGIHVRYAKRYKRRVRNAKTDPVSSFLIHNGMPFEEEDKNYIFTFYEKSPDTSVVKKDYRALDQLELFMVYSKSWADHNISSSVYYTNDEFLDVCSWIWKNFDHALGLTIFPHSDHVSNNPPFEEITEEEYQAGLKNMPTIDWDTLSLFEKEDMTTNMREMACGAGGCEIQ